MIKNLVIVESPAKAKTIEKYLGKEFKVTSSMGHVRDLVKGDAAIDIKNNFEPHYEISADKKDLVKNLIKMVSEAETVWLATDDDREGEAISWHLAEVLKLDVASTKRIVFNEITEPAIKKAIQNPRTIDNYLVDAQQARRVLDRIVGYELSPVLWKKVKSNLSAGRVQSVAVRLVVEREKEINAFNTSSEYKVKGVFLSNGKKIEATCGQTFKNKDEAQDFLQSLIGSIFKVSDVEVKPAFRNPSAPFTTSTLQQEASRKLGFSVSRTMTLAQRLYENGHISYMRTDSTNLSQTAIDSAKGAIEQNYGAKYSSPKNYSTKNANAQEAHEAIRPTNFLVTRAGDDASQQRLYDLIWKRSIASQMAKAELERTILTIESNKTKHTFKAEGEVIKFDGFLKVYMEGTDDDEANDEQAGLLPAVSVNEILNYSEIWAHQRFSKPAARYTEASLVKKLEELGIGRPSTYAPTISTIQKRNYVVNESRDGKKRTVEHFQLIENQINTHQETENYGTEKQKLFPTDIGTLVTQFLLDNFDTIMDYGFTASVEKEFDEIADGLKSWQKMLDSFYKPFHSMVETTTENAERVTGERILGQDTKSGKQVLVRIGRYGPLAQIGNKEDGDEIQFASLLPTQSIDNITLEDALKLFSLPRTLSKFNDQDVLINVGKFGPYIKYGEKFFSLPKGTDALAISEDEAMQILKEALDAPQFPLEVGEYNGHKLSVNKGRFGPYIKYDKAFVSIPKGEILETIDQARAIELIVAKEVADKAKILKTFEGDIQILNGRWGPYIAKGKDNYKLPKDTDIDKIQLADVEAIIKNQDNAAPAKKTATKKAAGAKSTAKKKAPAKKK